VKVRIFEVGVRDGLQNESQIISLRDKFKFVKDLLSVGLRHIELGSFVRSDRVPQMADTDQLVEQVRTLNHPTAKFWCLVPNQRGLERAVQVGMNHIALFTAVTESFAQNNIGMSIDDSIDEFRRVILDGRKRLGKKLKVRIYLSTVFGCPFEGMTSPRKALKTIEKVLKLDADEFSIGDTLGVATPRDVESLLKPLFKKVSAKKVALHFHDTRGTALANSLRAIDLGVRTLDSSAGGLGGCPYAPGASGNLATEDLVYMLNGMGIHTGINLDALCQVSLEIAQKLGQPLKSKYLQAFAADAKKNAKNRKKIG
jgi:hydroxymethylglutaryl-CoA lyase